MSSASKRKGAAFEALVVGYLRQWWPNAARTLAGARDDRGDVSGVPLVMELKNHKTVDLAGWWKEAEAEMHNACATRAVVVHKRKGVVDPALQWVTMPLWVLVDLLDRDGAA